MLVTGILVALGAARGPFVLNLVSGAFLMIAIGIARIHFARHVLPLRTLLAVPLYVFGKIPLYFAFVAKRQTAWIRTEREPAASS